MSTTPIDPSLQQIINIGVQSNDGTGDSIRDAFKKTNSNFGLLFGAATTGSGGLRFANLPDYAGHRINDPTGLTKLGGGDQVLFTRKIGNTSEIVLGTLVAGSGMRITTDSTTTSNGTNTTITISNTASSLVTDPNPTLGATLKGAGYRATQFADPIADHDLVTRQYLYDNFLNRDGSYNTGTDVSTSTTVEGSTIRHNIRLLTTATTATHLVNKAYADRKLSLAGTGTYDTFTGLKDPSFGIMTGDLILARNPVDSDNQSNLGLIAATKLYVDQNTYYSDNNLYISTKGSDYQPTVPPYKRGRNWQYAFQTLNEAARYAEELIATSRIEVGDYARLITYDNGKACTVDSVTDHFYSKDLAKLSLIAGTNGSDQFGVPGSANLGKFTIFPGQYVQGVDSGAIALIEGISSGPESEDYHIAYVDYATNFTVGITAKKPDPINHPYQMRFTLTDSRSNKMVPIPEFWVGYKFYLDTDFANVGTILDVESTADNAGIYSSSFLVEFTSEPPGERLDPLNPYPGDLWHVYSGDFIHGETIVYNTNVSALEISLIIESGEYYEQFPIKLPANTSIRGDEFRRVIIRPAKGISSSPWAASTYFRRDSQIDGLQVTQLDTSFDYATSSTLVNSSITPTSASGFSTFVLNGGSIPENYVGYIFQGNGGSGVITSVIGGGFVVNLGTPLANVETLTPTNWHLYRPVVFGWHYLRDSQRPINVLTTQDNPGGLDIATETLITNKTVIQDHVITYINQQIASAVDPLWTGFTYDSAVYRNAIGEVINSLAYDITYGSWGSIVNTAEILVKNHAVDYPQMSAAVEYINIYVQPILAATPKIEAMASAVVADLIQACSGIINQDTNYNPPKNSDQMDVFLCNDANVIRYVSCQNHGGFMMVLDPVGQIKNKSPYCQTASSFSQSIAKQAFRGGMFIDGFSGNMQVTPTTSTYVTTPLDITVTGLRRRPQVPTFFLVRGVRYEVDFIDQFAKDIILDDGTQTYSATLKLNPLTPGGIPNTITVNDTTGGFKPNQTDIPLIFDQPTGIGGLVASGHATTNNLGKISSIIVDFPGTGYTLSPNISIGGAVFNNLIFSGGGIVGASIVTGGAGYDVGCKITFVPVNAIGANPAIGQVTAVDSNGAITAFSITTPGTNWNNTVLYKNVFGNFVETLTYPFATINMTIPGPQSGFIDSVPDQLELITAGNRSMLANDFTQINDLGYGIFSTNGGFAENVSMFTYYNYRSYYALNGSQLRTLTGSSVYGTYGLCAEGSDPNEVPASVSLVYPLTQIAKAYVHPPLFPAVAGQTVLFVEIDTGNGGYPPLNSSQIEINHSGVIKTYSVGAAGPALDSSNNPIPNVYQLSFNIGNITIAGSTNVGLYAGLRNGDAVTIRAETTLKFRGLNPGTIARPSTSLVLNDDPAYVYHITGFSSVQPDSSVFVYTLEDYDYITFQTTDQGVTYPTITNTGSGYTSAVVTINSSSMYTGVTHSVFGDQGGGSGGVQVVSLNSVANIIIGHQVKGNSIFDPTYVTYINTVTNQIGISYPTTNTVTGDGLISNGTVLTFNSVAPSAYANIVNGSVSNIVINSGGAGWNVTATTIIISASNAGVNASISSPIKLAGVVGSNTIKISPLETLSASRILSGLEATPTRYYEIALNGQIYRIVAYRPTSVTGQSFAEIDIDRPLTTAVGQGIITRAGVQINSGGKVITRISLLRATGHDFVDVGTGGYADNRIPNDLYGPPINPPNPTNEVVQTNKARVYSVTSDQDGNFRVGSAFTVNQAKGSVSISAPISLSNLDSISLRRDLGNPINEFSTDNTMVQEADYKVPTEQAVANYINRRLGLDRNGAIYSGSPLGPQFLDLKGLLHMKGNIIMDGNTVTALPTPRAYSDPTGSGSTDASPKNYTDQRIPQLGTYATDTDGSTNATIQSQGVMGGPLQLFQDPDATTQVVTVDGGIATNRLYLDSVLNMSIQSQVYSSGIPTGTKITGIDYITTSVYLSSLITSTVPASTVVVIDPALQAATKKYVDKNKEFNQLVDVAVSTAKDTDFAMFGNPVAMNTGTNPPVYNSSTQVVNVTNNTATITNTPTSLGGGSDITVTRSNNTATFKLVGGKGSNNPVTDYHVNNDAQIQQSKLLMNTATVAFSAPTGGQRNQQLSLGVAQFDATMFTSDKGWISLYTATTVSNGIPVRAMTWVPTGGGLLGATNTSANTSATYVTSASIQTWLQNIGSDWSFSSNLNPNTDNVQNLGSASKRWSAVYANTATLDGGIVLNTNATINSNQSTLTIGPATVVGNQLTQNLYNTVATTVNAFGAATNLNLASAGGATVIKSNLEVKGTTIFQDTVTFNGTATYVLTTNTVYTDNLLELHTPAGGVGAAWGVDDGKDIGLRIHYYNGGDQNAGLVMAHDSRALEWYETGFEGVGTFAGTYGTFKTGNISLTGNLGVGGNFNVTGTTILNGNLGVGGNFNVTGTTILNGNLGVGGNFNVTGTTTLTGTLSASTGSFSGNVTDNNNRVVTSVSPGGSNHISIVASPTTTGPAVSFTVTSDATNVNTGDAIVARDNSGNFSAGTITANLTGYASNASSLNSAGASIYGTLGTSYTNAVQVREAGLGAAQGGVAGAAPRLGFHWAGLVASSIRLGPEGDFYFDNNPGTGLTNIHTNFMYGTAQYSQYADLAEKYQADAQYEPGTVLMFGGKFEVTVAGQDGTARVAGIVSTNPGHLMNNGLVGENIVELALTGRVPCKVRGQIRKGDLMVATNDGYARSEETPKMGSVIGKALEDFNGEEGVIEVVVGRM